VGNSLSAAQFECHEYGGSAGDLLQPFSLIAKTLRGLADADLGNKINRANAVQGAWGADAAGFESIKNIECVLSLTGANFSQLVKGKLRLYLEIIKLPRPEEVVNDAFATAPWGPQWGAG
jgi:hypothetical protein